MGDKAQLTVEGENSDVSEDEEPREEQTQRTWIPDQADSYSKALPSKVQKVCAVCVTVLSTGGNFHPVSNVTWLHVHPLAAHF